MTPMSAAEAGAGSIADISSAKRPPLTVDITRRAGAWEDVRDEILVRAARAAFAAVRGDAPPSEVSLLLTGDAEMSALNKSWRGEDGPTNVLSFPLDAPHGEAAPGMLQDVALGDVVLACETVMREAAERGIATGQHAAHLVVHAMLHLMGYDHMSDREAVKMEDLEVRILGTLGLADPYSLQFQTDGEGQ